MVRIISDYLPTRESGESRVCPSFGGQCETSMGRSSDNKRESQAIER